LPLSFAVLLILQRSTNVLGQNGRALCGMRWRTSRAPNVRAATTAFAKPCQRRRRLSALQANVVAPNYLYSEMYYPKARFVDATERNEQPREAFLARVLRSQPRLSVLLVDLLASVRWK
jgi:hypothetical protein